MLEGCRNYPARDVGDCEDGENWLNSGYIWKVQLIPDGMYVGQESQEGLQSFWPAQLEADNK